MLVTEMCLDIKDAFKFDSLEACKGKKAQPSKSQNSNFQVLEKNRY